MTNKQKKRVAEIVEMDGFSYAFDGYSDFPWITDEKFHELRKKYLDAKRQLEKYIEPKPY